MLPFASDEVLAQLESNLSGMPSVTSMLHEGLSVEDITAKLLTGLGAADGGFRLAPRFGPCEPSDLQQRMKRAVALLGEEEVRDIVAKEGKIEVRCEFCAEAFEFAEAEVLDAIASSTSASESD